MSNIKFVTNIMEHSNYGALSQMFVLDAIDKLSKQISKLDPNELDWDFINPHAWVGVANEIRTKLHAHYNKYEVSNEFD